MSAFGRRPGSGGQRPSFGVARPMKGGGPVPLPVDGGDQFPAIDNSALPIDDASTPAAFMSDGDAMARLNERMSAPGEAASAGKAEGFEASVHRIKQQVLPRLLERVDPEA